MHVGSPVDDQVIEVVEIPRAQMAWKPVELRRPGFWLIRSENHQARRERRLTGLAASLERLSAQQRVLGLDYEQRSPLVRGRQPATSVPG
jgi:hypothetical protein